MSAVIEFHIKSYTATEAVGAYIRVKRSGAGIAIAGVGEPGLGVTMANAAINTPVPVRLFNGFGSAFMVATGAIMSGAKAFPVAAGKISATQDVTAGGSIVGYAEEAATANGDIIEILLAGYVDQVPLASANQAAVVTTAPTNTSPYGFTTSIQAAALVTLVNQIRTDLITAGIMKGAA